MTRLLLLGVVLSSAWLAACGPTTRCGPSSCTGCCDATGLCRSGRESSACGSNGGSCSACTAGATCDFGACSSFGTGAGAAGAGSAGAGSAGGGSSGTGGGSATVTNWATFCTGVAAAMAGFSTRCGEYTAEGAAELQAAYVAQCMATTPPGIADGRSRFDAAAAQACLTLFNGRTCQQGLPSGCSYLVGLVALNGACYDGSDCTTDGWCDTATTCPGRCVARVAVGQPVSASALCVTGAVGVQGICRQLVAVGQSCAPLAGMTVAQPCVSGAACTNSVCTATPLDLNAGQACTPNTNPECSSGLQCVANTCVALGDVGAACDSARRCKWDLLCNSTNTCVRYGKTGATCHAQAGECATGYFCDLPTGMTTGTCAAKRPVGGACQTIAQCADGLFCPAATGQTAMCQAKGQVGAMCTNALRYAACADALYCTALTTGSTGVCANKKSASATCTDSAECQSSSCSTGRCTAPRCVDPTP